MATSRIGELLIADRVLTESAVRRAVGFQRISGEHFRLGTILVSWDLLAEEQLLSALARLHRCPAVTWSTLASARRETVRLLPATHAVRLGAVPYAAESGWIRAAFSNPSDLAKVDEVAAITGRRVLAAVTTEIRLLQAHHRFYGRPVPLHFRPIVQKLDRRERERARVDVGPREVDFGSAVERRSSQFVELSASVSKESGSPEMSLSEMALPPMPLPGFDSPPARKTPRSIEIVGEDSLTRWVSDALAAFQRERAPEVRTTSSPPDRGAPPQETPPPTSAAGEAFPRESASLAAAGESFAAAVAASDSIADMWVPSVAQEASEAIASGMWTPVGPSSDTSSTDGDLKRQVADSVIAAFLIEFPRVIIFGRDKDRIEAWGARGPGLGRDRVARLSIARDARSLFSSVQSWSPHFGAVAAGDWPEPLADALGSPAPPCAVFPVRLAEEIGGYLYADRLGAPMRRDDFTVLARASAATATLFSRTFVGTPSPARA